ncbi:hypothetical protein C0991_011601, partial [Blastosporella zonata]
TCKDLASATRKRCVWSDALTIVCRNNGLFSPSFPRAVMSNKALEHAALAPARFASMIMKDDGDRSRGIAPLSTRILMDSDSDVYFDSLCLIPGGRFMPAMESGDHLISSLWDLGFQTTIEPQRLASIPIPEYTSTICDYYPATSDGSGLFFFLLSDEEEGSKMYKSACSYVTAALTD